MAERDSEMAWPRDSVKATLNSQLAAEKISLSRGQHSAGLPRPALGLTMNRVFTKRLRTLIVLVLRGSVLD